MVGAPGRAGAISAAISTERGFLGVRRELGGEMCISSSGRSRFTRRRDVIILLGLGGNVFSLVGAPQSPSNVCVGSRLAVTQLRFGLVANL